LAGLTLAVARAADLTPAQRAEIIALCARAFGEPFDDWFGVLPGSTHVLGRLGGELVSHAAWVTRWLQPEGRPLLRAAYVEAVATATEHQDQGYASAVLRKLADEIVDFDLGGLSPSDAAFYERLGWESWRGPTAIRLPDGGSLDTTGEDVMILRLPRTPPLDLNSRLTAEWRRGELW
jgi:aminoglycoside 2'-N-acetyltransferase I